MIRLYRLKERLTQAELAKKAGLTQQQVSRIENGGQTTLRNLQKALHAMGYVIHIEKGTK